jgi:hypothetical protein
MPVYVANTIIASVVPRALSLVLASTTAVPDVTVPTTLVVNANLCVYTLCLLTQHAQ